MKPYLNLHVGRVPLASRNALVALAVRDRTFDVTHLTEHLDDDTYTVHLEARDRAGAVDLGRVLGVVFPSTSEDVIVDGELVASGPLPLPVPSVPDPDRARRLAPARLWLAVYLASVLSSFLVYMITK